MNWKESYTDIKAMLRIQQLYEIEARKRMEKAYEVIWAGEIPSSGSYVHIPVDRGIELYNVEVNELREVQEEIERLQFILTEMEKEMSKFTGLANVIQYKRIVEGKTYKELEQELGYDEAYMRLLVHRSSKNDNKMITHSTKAS